VQRKIYTIRQTVYLVKFTAGFFVLQNSQSLGHGEISTNKSISKT